MDIANAFDRAWHGGILNAVHSITSLHFTRIIFSLITDRSVQVTFEGSINKRTINPIYGVPQGSPISPLLFSLLFASAPLAATSNVTAYNYADDTFFAATAKLPEDCWALLQPCIEEFLQWASRNRLLVQPAKTETAFFTRRRATPNALFPPISIQGSIIPRQVSIRVLGVHLDKHLTLRSHIKKVSEGVAATIRQIRKFMTKHTNVPPYIAILLYKSLLRSKFTYAVPTLLLMRPTNWKKINVQEHRAMRAALRKGIRTKITHLYKAAKLKPFKQYYTDLAKRTVSRLIRNKNERVINTMLKTRHRSRRLAYTRPPLDAALDLFEADERRELSRAILDIRHETHFPP
jgi:hypothetical protein